MRGFLGFQQGNLVAEGDEDGLGHALVEGDDEVALRSLAGGVLEAADDRGVAAVGDLDDAAGALAGVWALVAGWEELDQDKIALHGGVELGGRDENVRILNTAAGANLLAACADIACRPNEAEAVTMEVESARNETGACCGGVGQAPLIAVGFDEGAARGEAGELLQQQAAFPAAAEAQFAD